MGSVTTNNDALHERLQVAYLDLGMGVGANDVELVLRGLPTMQARYHLHDAAARDLASWLAGHTAIRGILHPALEGSPGHEHWATHCSLAAGLFSVLVDDAYTSSQVDSFCDRLELFGTGLSWGGPMSLVMPYDLPSIRNGAGVMQATWCVFPSTWKASMTCGKTWLGRCTGLLAVTHRRRSHLRRLCGQTGCPIRLSLYTERPLSEGTSSRAPANRTRD